MRTPTQQVIDEENKAMQDLCKATVSELSDWWNARRALYLEQIQRTRRERT